TANAAEAREVVRVAKTQNMVLSEAFMYRHHPVYDRVEELIREGAIGDLVSIRSEFAFFLDDPESISGKAELAGGSLMDVGCYSVNLSRRFAGCEPVRVTAQERRGAVDNTMIGCMEFPTGLLAHFECSFETRERTRAEFIGTEGEIVLRNPWFPGEEYGEVLLRRGNKTEGISTRGANCYHLEVDDFVHACKTREPLRWPADDAIKNMAVIDALHKAAKEGRAVPVEA
ncbi:MAG: Gfo/Idh/MocA family oxidoreductase, partial [bacterium]|nr:Gfo/Idh/MocA family oxidoreductase [bacterium]